MDRAESVFHRLAVRIGALSDIVTVDIKAECEDRSRRSGLDHGAETGETVHFFDDFRVGASASARSMALFRTLSDG